MEQFRRFANLYFLIVGGIMALGEYTKPFETAISPWTTWGPLAFVIAISLSVEGSADRRRHRNDKETNNATCVVLRRGEDIDAQAEEEGKNAHDERDDFVLKGKDVVVNIALGISRQDDKQTASSNEVVKIGFQKIRRMDIRQGQFVLVKNREMVPADLVLLASSNDQGGAYIETSSIDGETNLKLRTSPRLPEEVLDALKARQSLMAIREETGDDKPVVESIEAATKRLTRMSALGHPEAPSVVDHPEYTLDDSGQAPQTGAQAPSRRTSRLGVAMDNIRHQSVRNHEVQSPSSLGTPRNYVAALVSEPPNPSVHTFSGKLTLPPLSADTGCHDIPLGAENMLLRGAVLRNTEWAIGLAVFTGDDTKLIQNSHETPSKFSQLDKLMNTTVVAILVIMWIVISFLASQAVATNRESFDQLFYAGFNTDASEPWPYLPNLPPPKWENTTNNFIQFFFLYVTLLTNFVPLSLYVTVEMVIVVNMIFMYCDIDIYDDTTDTRALARSTTVTDLGCIQYIFSDKTGTLTQNVMRFKRCSVDGMIFGAPIQKSRPDALLTEEPTPFHPLRQLLLGRFQRTASSKQVEVDSLSETDKKLTFNAEMFLRVMSLCHTVVVEKDIDSKDGIDESASVASNRSNRSLRLFGRKRANTGDSTGTPLGSIHEADHKDGSGRQRTHSQGSFAPGQNPRDMTGPDGAPAGYAYQAESPDEGALVTAASSTFGFQVISRDSSGITLRSNFPSHLEDETTRNGLASGSLTIKRIAAESAQTIDSKGPIPPPPSFNSPSDQRIDEKWQILAVNKFDSDRKRMSILLRSPPELGSLAILFCKGADSAMLDPSVCSGVQITEPDGMTSIRNMSIVKPVSIGARGRDVSQMSALSEGDDAGGEPLDEDGWEMAQMLGIQAHLGDFAKEGLRTLVLGMKVLTSAECDSWLAEYKAASVSLTNRDELLTAAAKKVECELHIVGATAIEDKLQKDVPETISQISRAGIKLWVLTGDKRETAIEIGYSTNVLTPKMHLTEVSDKGEKYVQTQLAFEFLRLVKLGKLKEYQKRELDSQSPSFKTRVAKVKFVVGKGFRAIKRAVMLVVASLLAVFCSEKSTKLKQKVRVSEEKEKDLVEDAEKKRRVRFRAEELVQSWLKTEQKNVPRSPKAGAEKSDDVSEDLSLASEETPAVFERASSARSLLRSMKDSGGLSQQELRHLSIAHLTSQQADGDEPLVDEDTLSLQSLAIGMTTLDFDKKKRTVLERLFAIDKEVRKGHLRKHLSVEKIQSIQEEALEKSLRSAGLANSVAGPRALVIEGAALKLLLGDADLEGILFAVASQCDAVIACRVSPKQKALLVNLVRRNVVPEPVTLAIGDGANDVGMIQEAHVGVGISGKEGQQAVNASDFAIAQFRFLEELVLIHGRWTFFRLSTVVLFSFYKNAVMVGTLVVYAERTLYTGTPLYDEWVIAVLNFVATFPIIFLGVFDRCLGKDYVKAHPEVYRASRENELITFRTLTRWIALVFLHIFTIYYLSVPQQVHGGGITSAFQGLMGNNDRDVPGDGEGGDLKSVGTVTFTCLIVLLAYKVMFESRSIVHGMWPPFSFKRDDKDGMLSRLPYTWIGVTVLSILFYAFFLGIYQLLGRPAVSAFSNFVNVTNHAFGSSLMSWMLVLFVPIAGVAFDVTGKVFSNMFYPTQTQIHIEIEAKERGNQPS